MAEAPPYGCLRLISQGLHGRVSGIIGPECGIKLRRQNWEIFETFASCDGCTVKFARRIPSGSMAEGFLFRSSDQDFMFICNDVLVLNSNLYHIWNTTDKTTVLLMETENVSPGFTLLRSLKYDFRRLTNILIGNEAYYSSKIAREAFNPGCMSSHHGPCKSFDYFGIEYDYAYTLQCPVWPKDAISFIHRSLRHGWPSYGLLTDLIKDGCLLVPINSKQQTCSVLIDFEWRISFSLAEKKLVHSMNHSQFLCYGLMKMFLNEVLKKIPETGELLCSYFMKTSVFWEISECSNEWTKSNFLVKFWNAFRRIMKWISIGYCPNFFIPEHNMFYGKIYGSQQRNLIRSLRVLYEEGYMCLLRCPTLHADLSLMINCPSMVYFLPANEDSNVPPSELEKGNAIVVGYNFGFFPMVASVSDLVKILYNIISIVPSSDVSVSAIKLRMNALLQKIAKKLHSNQTCTSNRLKYRSIKTSQSILRRTRSKYCLNKIFLAVCSYENGEYKKTMQICHLIKQRLQRNPYTYEWDLDGDFILKCRQHGMSYDEIFKSHIIVPFTYDSEMSISELYMEIHTVFKNARRNTMFMSPLVFMNFLLILCYTRLSDAYKRYDVLNELHTLLLYDDGHHISPNSTATSWEILGICQHLCGDYQGAFQSFTKALNDKFNYFKQATIVRMLLLVFHLI